MSYSTLSTLLTVDCFICRMLGWVWGMNMTSPRNSGAKCPRLCHSFDIPQIFAFFLWKILGNFTSPGLQMRQFEEFRGVKSLA